MPRTDRSQQEFITELPDGTVKQVNPFSGTEVWTVPGRGHRPLGVERPAPQPVDPDDADRLCTFCSERLLETPPEKARVVRSAEGGYAILRDVPAEELFDSIAEFRRVPNLFEILSAEYWRVNHGHEPGPAVATRRAEYLATAAGRAHVLDVVGVKLRAAGRGAEEVAAMPEEERLEAASGFFGGGHDLIIARRHCVDGARDAHELAGSGTLSVAGHRAFIALTVDTMRDLYAGNPHARYVSVFQNWLRPAGASFDHLHKQLVAIDEIGAQNEATLERVRATPDAFAQDAVGYAERRGLVIARNDHAVMFAGFGHRYPTVEIHSQAEACDPWEQFDAERDAMADLIHAAHAATGAEVPSNEEWHTRPAGLTEVLPWRVCLKWRVSTLAGFEGATKIYLNTISPAGVRDRVVTRLRELRVAGAISRDVVIEGDR
ncbi:MAG: DUF4921 family protein [Micrococcus sp.]|nr:DUF4921 family protein [Micrococcus sp.]